MVTLASTAVMTVPAFRVENGSTRARLSTCNEHFESRRRSRAIAAWRCAHLLPARLDRRTARHATLMVRRASPAPYFLLHGWGALAETGNDGDESQRQAPFAGHGPGERVARRERVALRERGEPPAVE